MSEWVQSLEERAADVLPEPVYRYFRQGARDGVSAAEAVAAWGLFRLVPHVLRDVTHVDTSSSVLGTRLRAPLAVAPTTLHRAAHADGEVEMARAVARAGSLLVVSSNAGSTFEAIGTTGVPWWFQVYVTADRDVCRPLVERAVAAGARAVVLTADTPVVGTKYDPPGQTVWDAVDPAWSRVNYSEHDITTAGGDKATDLRPADIGWLTDISGLPVVVKGVLRPDDARVCVDSGAAAVWVSNHGGRQLDHTAATAKCLTAVAEEVGSDAEVYVDGGIRSAHHVLSAVSLGARAAFLGRLPLYALAVGGAAGVTQLFAELEDELVEIMRLAGVAELHAGGSESLGSLAVDGRHPDADPPYPL